jgi:hypothetical protein
MSNIITTGNSTAFTLAYEWSPIIMTDGIFSWSPLGFPIIAVTQALASAGTVNASILSGGNIAPFKQPLFTWRPMPGSTLWESEVAEFPFYTNQIAANAQVQRPLRVSMLGHCPAGGGTPWVIKIATMTALQKVIQAHINAGGTFTVLTPSYVYTGCLLVNFQDVSAGETNQSQVSWQMDFMQPLITFPNVGGALSTFMTTIANGGQSIATGGQL